MLLHEAIAAAGMTPPQHIPSGRFVRFPGAGKGHSNTAGWCKVLTPTLAIYGDWSTGLSEIWREDDHRDDERSRRLLAEARDAQRRAQLEAARRAREVARTADRMILEARQDTHPYLVAKGFKHTLGLVNGDLLLVPIRAVEGYERTISMQTIAPDGSKRFLPGGRVKGGIHRLGSPKGRVALCEGFATGLTLKAAFALLPGPWAIVVCFSAGNLVAVAPEFPGAVVCADNDHPDKRGIKAGEEAAKQTGLKWVMPPDIGTDYNDMHRARELIHVVEALRGVAA